MHWLRFKVTKYFLFISICLLFPSVAFAEGPTEGTEIANWGSQEEISSLNDVTTAGSTISNVTIRSLKRYPAEERVWLTMVDTAFYRDAMVGIETRIENAVPGEYWTVKLKNLVTNEVIEWGNVRFGSYGEEDDCFISTRWYSCGSNRITVFWYVKIQCESTGTWQWEIYKQGTNLNFPAAETQFNLLPQIPEGAVPSGQDYNQNNYLQDYDDSCLSSTGKLISCTGASGEEKLSIANLGCYLVSAVMMLKYHGVDIGADDTAVNVVNLHNYLKNHEGFFSKGFVDPFKVAEYSNGKISYQHYIKYNSSYNLLEDSICYYGPQILHSAFVSEFFTPHWLIVTGENADKTAWKVVDPDGGNETEFNYGYVGYDLYVGPLHSWQDRHGFITQFYSPGELLITDSLGRKTGYDPRTGIEYAEIPYSSYNKAGASINEVKRLIITRPADGEYDLEIIGTGEGDYDIEMRAYDQQGGTSLSSLFTKIPISPGVVHSFALNYSKNIGGESELLGGFDGKGQRPRDVNKFISFVNINQVRNELPTGTTTFDLAVSYDKTTIPESFTAELNGVDITSQFSPSPGSVDVVKLNLLSGSNTLVISINGTVVSGRIARDTDRLVFIVQ